MYIDRYYYIYISRLDLVVGRLVTVHLMMDVKRDIVGPKHPFVYEIKKIVLICTVCYTVHILCCVGCDISEL